ncbi:MAG: UbiA family prenyltransferase [Burkholderiales bacterium]|nr:UbiA family prenyltransferase [Burkholderiales bacterium]
MREPLYVDLDGTLTYTDLLLESALLLLKRNPMSVFLLVWWTLLGRARLKAEIAARVDLDVTILPYNTALLNKLKAEKAAGRKLVLASASNHKWVEAIALHLNLFDDILASDGQNNLRSNKKRVAIEAQTQGQPYAYAGNSRVDFPVWAGAKEVWVVNAGSATEKAALKKYPGAICIPARPVTFKTFMKALRLHQWAKNALMFLPLLAAHSLNVQSWLTVLVGFLIFGACASATYVINDLWDLASDRQHPRKCDRPFASALLPISTGVMLVGVLLPGSLIAAACLSTQFFLLVALYVVITLCYSFRLKKIPLLDVVVLAILYTHRIFTGGVLAGLAVTHWLMVVSLFIFLSLALVKRCTELEWVRESGKLDAAGRGYRVGDLSYLVSMGVASGFVAVLVLALYIETQRGSVAYPNAGALWFVLPVLMYWIMRLWIKTSRMEIHDDPLLFAAKDRSSWGVAACIGVIAIIASVKWT